MPHSGWTLFAAPPRVLLCYLLRSASRLPLSLHFFLSNFLFVRWELPPSKETSYLLSDVLIFFKEFLGPLKRPPFLLSEFSVQPTLVGTAHLSCKHPGEAQGSCDRLTDNQIATLNLHLHPVFSCSCWLETSSSNDAKSSEFASFLTIL